MSSLITDDALGPFLLVRTLCGRKVSQVTENHSSCFNREIFIAAMKKENLTTWFGEIRKIHLARFCAGSPKGNVDRSVDTAWGSTKEKNVHTAAKIVFDKVRTEGK